MNPLMKRFFIRTILVSVLLLIAGYVIYTRVIPKLYSPCVLYLLIFFFLITNTLHYLLLKIKDKNILKFSTYYLGISFLKMVIYLAFAGIVIFFHREHARIFLLNFLVIYITFSAMEVYEISRIMRRKN